MYKTEAIILRRRDMKERDKLITVYTKDFGKIKVRAIGAKKIESKLGGHVEPFMRTDIFVVDSKTIDILAGATVLATYINVRSTLSGLHAAQYIMEVADRLTLEAQADSGLFSILAEGLSTLDAQSKINFLTVQSIALRILSRVGFEPILDRCAHCGKPVDPGSMAFHALAGGMVHMACAPEHGESHPLGEETRKTLKCAIQASLSSLSQLRVSAQVWEQFNQCVDDMVLMHASKPIYSRAFLGSLV